MEHRIYWDKGLVGAIATDEERDGSKYILEMDQVGIEQE